MFQQIALPCSNLLVLRATVWWSTTHSPSNTAHHHSVGRDGSNVTKQMFSFFSPKIPSKSHRNISLGSLWVSTFALVRDPAQRHRSRDWCGEVSRERTDLPFKDQTLHYLISFSSMDLSNGSRGDLFSLRTFKETWRKNVLPIHVAWVFCPLSATDMNANSCASVLK